MQKVNFPQGDYGVIACSISKSTSQLTFRIVGDIILIKFGRKQNMPNFIKIVILKSGNA